MQRKNHLRKFISGQIGKKTKTFQSKIKNKLTTIYIDVNKFRNSNKPLIEHFENLDLYYNKINKILENENSIKITYEDDILINPNIAYNKIINFIGLEEFKPKITLKKQNPYSLKELIENYDEVEKYLENTKYEWMLFE